MFDLYVPVLKAKEGEFAALEALHSAARDKTVPLLEIPDVPFDHASGMSSKTLDQHISSLPDRIAKAWGTRDFYLDTPNFAGKDSVRDGACALDVLLTACEANATQPIPVIRANSSEACLSSVRKREKHRVCIRLSLSDFSEDTDTNETIEHLLTQLSRSDLHHIDLMVDLGELPKEQATSLLIARSVLSMTPKKDEWRRVILSSSAFPEDLSGVSSKSIDRIARREWLLWLALQKKRSLLPTNLIYSDNTISHPTLKGIDPRIMRMSAAIRYTAQRDWIIVKGGSVGRFGFEQYFDLCKSLVALPEFAGEGFSWGDGFIADCARSMVGPGNATTWRKVGVNHHITLVTYQLSNSDEI